MLVLELLGTLSLRDDAGPVPLAAQQKRRVGFLAILALAGRQGLSRHRIEAYLWSESTADRARHALDQVVYAVRHSLGSDIIVSTGQELRLNPEMIRADIWEFGDLIGAGEWIRAAALYKGTLLDGFHFGESRELESWIDAERARLLREYQRAIECLADRSAEAGDHSQGVSWRRRLASSDPLSAGLAKKLILALAASGDRAGAVKQARQYQELVRQELEMEPDAEIEGLASTLSRPSASGSVATVPSFSAMANGKSESPAWAAPDGHSGASDLHDRGRQPSHGVVRSRMAGLASLSILAAAVFAALLATSAKGRASRANVAGGAAPSGARVALPAARQAYLLGINAWEDRTREGHDRAIGFFRRATALDPEYAEAYAGLAEAYVRIGYFGYRPADAMFPKAKAAALRSMQLDSTLSSAHTALATELVWEHDFVGAESEHRKAIAFEPTNATAHQWYGVLLMILGRVPEAVAQEKRAADLEPLSLQIQNNYATFLNSSGDHLGALRHFQRAIGEEPDSAWVRRNPWVLANMARVYADNGQHATAAQMMTRALRIVPGSPRALYTMAMIQVRAGRNDLAWQAFARADTLNEQYPAYRGMLYAVEGKRDSAFLWFDRAAKWGVQPMLSLQADRLIDPMRDDPRFDALLRRLGIPARRSTPPARPPS